MSLLRLQLYQLSKPNSTQLEMEYLEDGTAPRHENLTTLRGSFDAQVSVSDSAEVLEIGETDLLVVGAGSLGSLVAQLWLEKNKNCKVVGQTNTTAHHEELRSIGVIPVVKDGQKARFPYVIFCAPPLGSVDYPAEVRAAAQRWNGKGSLLFTSSSVLYDVSDNGICDEGSALTVPKGRGPRTDNLLNAEEEVLKVSGNVVRLSGLYTLNRGAHKYYLSKGIVAARPDHIVNLIHYEDAATLCMAILKTESRGQIFMGCDGCPVSRQETMDAVNKSGKYEEKFMQFRIVDGPLGKRMSNGYTREVTGWKPKYESFPSFLGVTTIPRPAVGPNFNENVDTDLKTYLATRHGDWPCSDFLNIFSCKHEHGRISNKAEFDVYALIEMLHHSSRNLLTSGCPFWSGRCSLAPRFELLFAQKRKRFQDFEKYSKAELLF